MAGNRRPAALVYGKNPVREALRAGRDVRRILVAAASRAEPRLTEILDVARARGIEVEETDRRRLDEVAHTESHQGVVAYVTRRQYVELDELLDGVAADPPPIVLVLDGIQDPQNLGGICRTAEAAGVAGVVLPKHRAAEVTPAVAKRIDTARAKVRAHVWSQLPGGVPASKVADTDLGDTVVLDVDATLVTTHSTGIGTGW